VAVKIEQNKPKQSSLDDRIVETVQMSEKKASKMFVDFIMYSLRAPFITWPGYEDSWTEEHRTKAQLLRMTAHKDFEQELCTKYEAMIYFSTVSFEHAPDTDYADAYMHCFAEYFDYKLIEPDRELRELEQGAASLLYNLRHCIFMTQMKHLKAKYHSTPKEELRKEPAVQGSLAEFLQ
jgi:hypothetical protein